MIGSRSLRTRRARPAAPSPHVPAGRWTVDRERSTVTFTVKHLTVATVRGAFDHFAGWFETDEEGVTAAAGTVEAASVTTGEAKRDAALLGPGFLDADRHPTIALSSRAVLHARDGTSQLVADLTMKGITRRIRLTGASASLEDNSGTSRARIIASGTISRAEFGVTGGGILESAGAVVSDTVKVELKVSAVLEPEMRP